VNRRARRINTLPDDQAIRHETAEELQEILRNLNIRKAPGWNEIGNIALRKRSRYGIAALLNIVKAILRLRHFPAEDPLFPQNYRPISLLPSLGKVVEVIILRRLKEQEEDLHVIPDGQFGFRRTLATELQVLRMTEYITEGFNGKEATGAVPLHVSNSFDRIWHRGLK